MTDNKGSFEETNESLTEKYNAYLKNRESFEEVLEEVRKYADGKIWIIGGFVYGNLVKQVYPENEISKRYHYDLDFVIENMKISKEESDWEKDWTSYGSPTLKKGNRSIDLNLKENFYPLTLWKRTAPDIQDYLRYAPLTIQAVVYECDEIGIYNGKIIASRVFLDSLKKQIIEINHEGTAKVYAEKKGRDIEEIIREKARELGFKAIL